MSVFKDHFFPVSRRREAPTAPKQNFGAELLYATFGVWPNLRFCNSFRALIHLNSQVFSLFQSVSVECRYPKIMRPDTSLD